MGRPTFFRVALLLPLVAPLLSLALMWVFDDQLTSGPLLGFAMIIAGAALYYTAPYLIVATYLFIRLPSWTLSQQQSALWIAPLVVTVLSAIGAAIWYAAAGSGGWWSNVGTAFALGLPCGYAYSGIIAIVEYVTRPAGAATAPGGVTNPPEMKRLAAVLLLGSTLLAAACGGPLLRSPRLLSAYKVGDPREQLVGRWAVEFARGDSTAVGTLTLTDTLGSPIKSTLLGRLEVDMTPVVGRSNECLQRGNKSHSVRLEHDSLRLSFSHYSECFVEALTARYGDSAAGQWTQAWLGPTCCLSGTFRMWRLR